MEPKKLGIQFRRTSSQGLLISIPLTYPVLCLSATLYSYTRARVINGVTDRPECS